MRGKSVSRLILALVLLMAGAHLLAAPPADANPFRQAPAEATEAAPETARPEAAAEGAGENAPAASPFTGKPAAGSSPSATVTQEPSFFNAVFAWVRKIQREVTQSIAAYMADLAAERSAEALLYGVFLSFLYGVFHTAGPGHGKAVVISYFLSHPAGFGRAFAMGSKIAVTHVISAVLLVGLADISLRAILGGSPAQVFWVKQASYAAIAGVGLWMLVRAVGRIRKARAEGVAVLAEDTCCHHDHFGADHSHDHGHDHRHDHAHAHSHTHSHTHSQESQTADPTAKREQSLLSIGAGLVPCTGALLIMLFALANDLVLEGVILVAAISLGMAAAVSAIALACIFARSFVAARARTEAATGLKVAVAAEVTGALVITAVGVLFLAAAFPVA